LFRSKHNRFVTVFAPEVQEAETEMTPLRATLLSFAMLSAITFWGIAIYTADAAGNHTVVDGYGVTALTR
jgi:hypothetical protein